MTSDLRRCIYCHEPLGPKTREAHVIPRCLGGRLASKTMCCNDCNNALSRFESILCMDLRTLSAALAARNAQNQPITAMVQFGGKTFKYADGVGDERLPPPKYDPETRALRFSLPGGAEEQATLVARIL